MNVATLAAQASTAPKRIRAGAGLITACAVVLVLLSIARAVIGAGVIALVVPLLLALAQLGSAGAVVFRRPFARLLAGALLVLTGLLYAVIALGEGAWWFRVLAALLLAAQVAAGLLIAGPRNTEASGQ